LDTAMEVADGKDPAVEAAEGNKVAKAV